MSSTEPREHRQICTRGIAKRNTWGRGNTCSTEPRDPGSTHSTCTPRITYSRNTASTLSARVVPSESNLLQLFLVGQSVSVLWRTMGLRYAGTVHRRSKYTSFSDYTGHIEGIPVLEYSQYEHQQRTKY